MSKIKGLADALDGIEDGASIGIGGWIFNSPAIFWMCASFISKWADDLPKHTRRVKRNPEIFCAPPA